MKLILKNFRCHENKIFEFDDNGLILILGSSGQGKSTILNAILFVLYGVGKKLQTFGKTTCSVEFEYKELKIIRTKTPNRLILNQNNLEYEDDAAQNIINNIFGSNFDVVSYIPQNVVTSFIVKSPIEKLEFLEMFAFKDVNLCVIKERCKNEINIRKEQLNKTINQIEITKNILKEMKEPVEILFPLNGKGPKEKLIKNEEIRLKNSEIRLKKFKIQLNKLQNELKDILVLDTYINSKNESLESLNLQLEQLNIDETDISYIGDESLELYKKRLLNVLSKKEYFNLQKKYNDDLEKLNNMKQIEIKNYTKELNKINNNLWIEYSKDEAISLIKDFKIFLKDAKEISKLRKKIANYKIIDYSEIEQKKQKLEENKTKLQEYKDLLEKLKKQDKIYNCPNCNISLNFIENKLIICNSSNIENNYENNYENIMNSITLLQNEIKTLENIIPNDEYEFKSKIKDENNLNNILSEYEDEPIENNIENDLIDLENYYSFQLKEEIRKAEIENILTTENFSSSFVTFKKNLLDIELKLKDINTTFENEDLSEDELKNIISIQEKNKQKLDYLSTRKKQIEEESLKYNIKLEELRNKHIEKYKTINSIDFIKTNIKNIENEILETENKKKEHSHNLNNIEKYNNYINEKEKFLNFQKNICNLENQEKIDRKKYNSALLLKDKILEAESIALSNVINSINNHAQLYLDYFFPDNPIIVKLLSFKETKKNSKPQINIEIEYKGNECELTSLSGGELQRVVLAFTLALSEMFNTNILMLDECTSNLNQELTNTVFEAIKENFKNKFVLIVAHQVVTGLFDKVINI